jgi:tRNA pseudouridine38-40 synthase
MQNIKLILSYEGTRYLGWQKTPTGPTIEEELEKALAQILRHPVSLQAASRTDAGVHAKGQVVNFFTDTNIVLEKLMHGLNGILPHDIAVRQMDKMPLSFHPTLDNRGKEYHYFACLSQAQLPFYRHFSWHLSYPVDLGAMEQAARLLQGRHDFSAFTNERQDDNVREIFEIEVLPLPHNRLKIRVSGNHFLYKMVRNIAGTLLYVGSGKIAWQKIPQILESKDRTRAGVTAPAHGLFLTNVVYD